MRGRGGAGERAQGVKRWTELQSAMASAAARTGTERDNLPVSEIKGEKPKALFHLQRAASRMMDTSLSARVWSSAEHELLRAAYLAVLDHNEQRQKTNCFLLRRKSEKTSTSIHSIPVWAIFSCIWELANFCVWICAFVMRRFECGTVMSASLHAEGIPSRMIHPHPTVAWMLVILCIHSTHSTHSPTPTLLLRILTVFPPGFPPTLPVITTE